MHKTRRWKMTVDVDEGKKAEEQSRFLAQLQATLNVIPAYAWYAAPSGGITFVNKRTADYLGLPNDHPLRFGIDIGAQWDAHIPLLHPDDHEKSRKSWSTCLRTGEFAEESFRVRNAQGGYRWFRSRVEPLRASDGTLLQWVGVNVDIDELKCAERALRRANTSSVKSSKRYQASSGQRTPPANRPNSISAFWTTAACDWRIFSIVVGKHSCTRPTFQKLQRLSIRQFRPELPTRLCTVCVGRTANIAGTMLAVSRCTTERGGSSSGTACMSILMKA